jgi:hypothetical protein
MRHHLIIALLVAVPFSVYAAPPQRFTEMKNDPAKIPAMLESQVLEDALSHYEQMDAAKANALSHQTMAPHMTGAEMAKADWDHDGTIDRGEYLVETEKRFHDADSNHDGMISTKEWASAAGQQLLLMLRMPLK